MSQAENSPEGSRSRGTGKRWLFSLVLSVLIYAFIESAAWLGLWVLDGTPFSLERLDHERSERVPAQAPLATGEQPPETAW